MNATRPTPDPCPFCDSPDCRQFGCLRSGTARRTRVRPADGPGAVPHFEHAATGEGRA